jgi:ribA/ribD-fused uncharacterized protein
VGDFQGAKAIVNATTPAKAKSLGRVVKDVNGIFPNQAWAKESLKVMEHALILKFNHNTAIRTRLCGTHPKPLYEATKDKLWGIGYTAENAQKVAIDKFGRNWLGKCLEKVRKNFLKGGKYLDFPEENSSSIDPLKFEITQFKQATGSDSDEKAEDEEAEDEETDDEETDDEEANNDKFPYFYEDPDNDEDERKRVKLLAFLEAQEFRQTKYKAEFDNEDYGNN